MAKSILVLATLSGGTASAFTTNPMIPSRVMQYKTLLADSSQQPGKGDLYSDEELFDLLNLHLSLNPEQELQEKQLDEELNIASIGGIHDLVLDAIGETSTAIEQQPNTNINEMRFDHLKTILRDKKPYISAIATDVDGTLLSGGQQLHPITRDAVIKAVNMCYSDNSNNKIKHFFPATGKSRKGAIKSLGEDIGPLLHRCPGVYIQGLYCIDSQGNVVFEKKLSPEVVRDAEQLVHDSGISICGYDGDNLFTTEITDVVRSLSDFYGEPVVQLILGDDGSAITLSEHKNGCHKLLLMDENSDMLTTVVRPKLEALAETHGVIVTQALPTMLELLPAGCSKAVGVEKLCEALDIDTETELLALGDAENDVEMLKAAAIGVAVGNACSLACSAADFIMTERHDEGGAGLAIEQFGFD